MIEADAEQASQLPHSIITNNSGLILAVILDAWMEERVKDWIAAHIEKIQTLRPGL